MTMSVVIFHHFTKAPEKKDKNNYQCFSYSQNDALVSCLKNNIKIYINILI